MSETEEHINNGDHRRKVLAILAGGLVLGVGAAVTLAAWNDSEFAQGEFTAGSFNLEGATNGAAGTYEDHDVAGNPAALTFTLPADNLTPGDSVAAPFWVRLDETTTHNALLTATGVTGTGDNAANLSYDVYTLAPEDTCNISTSGTTIASGDDLTEFTAGTAADLVAGAGTAAGTPVQLCFVVTAESTLVQGADAAATWQFTATSE